MNRAHWPQRRKARCFAFLAVTVFVTLFTTAAEFANSNSPAVEVAITLPNGAKSISRQNQQDDTIPQINVAEIDAAAGSPLHWFDDYQAAREVSRLTKKPLFVVIRCER
jgi:hypothetical protein